MTARKYLSIINKDGDDIYLKDAEAREAISQIDLSAVTSKADKVSGATSGNLASLNGSGNIADSGYSSSDFVLSSSFATTAECIAAAGELT